MRQRWRTRYERNNVASVHYRMFVCLYESNKCEHMV